MTAADRCRAILTQIGRPELAATIGTNRIGNPTRGPEGYGDDAELVARAFIEAHTETPDQGDRRPPRPWQVEEMTNRLRQPLTGQAAEVARRCQEATP